MTGQANRIEHAMTTDFKKTVSSYYLDGMALDGQGNVRFGRPEMQGIYGTMVDPAAAQALAQGRTPDTLTSHLYEGKAPVPAAPIARTAFAL